MIFGGIIGTMGCYYGFRTKAAPGASSRTTTRAVVGACVLVLISDYLLANFLFQILFAKNDPDPRASQAAGGTPCSTAWIGVPREKPWW
jgi:hypothetical protein